MVDILIPQTPAIADIAMFQRRLAVEALAYIGGEKIEKKRKMDAYKKGGNIKQ